MKKVPLRRCVATNLQLPKKELIRIVKTPDGQVVVDKTGKVNGHGAYLQISCEAFEIAKNKKILDKVLDTKVNDEIYEELSKLL